MPQTPEIILASTSPRRQELLRTLNVPYRIVASEADESTSPGLSPGEIVTELALRKARAVAERLTAVDNSTLIIGADTIVVLDGQVLGKPGDQQEAVRMLRLLQGKTHEVYSGVAIVAAGAGRSRAEYRRTRVTMKAMDEERILRYVATGEPADKAGAYAIQGFGATLVDKIDGDYFNVVGLPLALLSDMLEEWGVRIV